MYLSIGGSAQGSGAGPGDGSLCRWWLVVVLLAFASGAVLGAQDPALQVVWMLDLGIRQIAHPRVALYLACFVLHVGSLAALLVFTPALVLYGLIVQAKNLAKRRVLAPGQDQAAGKPCEKATDVGC